MIIIMMIVATVALARSRGGGGGGGGGPGRPPAAAARRACQLELDYGHSGHGIIVSLGLCHRAVSQVTVRPGRPPGGRVAGHTFPGILQVQVHIVVPPS
jgi:hypothetical protein